jgi:tRNA pseudouridine13 synthase
MLHDRDEVSDDLPLAKRQRTQEPSVLPPSHTLLGVPPNAVSSDGGFNLGETDVGISEYVSSSLAPMQGIIKQR